MGDKGYLTIRQAAKLVGIEPTRSKLARLRAVLVQKSVRSGDSFLQRCGDSDQSPYLVTEASLRKHCPELFSREDEAYRAIAELHESMQGQLDELRNRVARIERMAETASMHES